MTKLEQLKTGADFKVTTELLKNRFKMKYSEIGESHFLVENGIFKCLISSMDEEKIEVFNFLFHVRVESVIYLKDIELVETPLDWMEDIDVLDLQRKGF